MEALFRSPQKKNYSIAMIIKPLSSLPLNRKPRSFSLADKVNIEDGEHNERFYKRKKLIYIKRRFVGHRIKSLRLFCVISNRITSVKLTIPST